MIMGRSTAICKSNQRRYDCHNITRVYINKKKNINWNSNSTNTINNNNDKEKKYMTPNYQYQCLELENNISRVHTQEY